MDIPRIVVAKIFQACADHAADHEIAVWHPRADGALDNGLPHPKYARRRRTGNIWTCWVRPSAVQLTLLRAVCRLSEQSKPVVPVGTVSNCYLLTPSFGQRLNG